jgi:transcriptional regulator with XRE-family HTH domain
VRLLRLRLGWRQVDLAARAQVSRGLVSLIECDRFHAVTFGAAQRVAEALDARLVVDLQWAGAELDRLLDAGHAALAEWLAAVLRRYGWDVRAEVSFNHYGDRGRYDLLAFHAPSGVVLIVEVKTAIGDMQDLLGRLDVKVRMGKGTALHLGWRPRSTVPMLLIAEGDTNRRRVRDHQNLLVMLNLRGRAAPAWLRHPASSVPNGLLMFRELANANHRSLIRVSRVRKARMQTRPAVAAPAANSPP